MARRTERNDRARVQGQTLVGQARALLGNVPAARPASVSEQDHRAEILNAILRTPHGDIEPYIHPFCVVFNEDPLFFERLAVWYCDNGTVRDLQHLFIAILCAARNASARQTGLALLERRAPYELSRILRLIKGDSTGARFRPGLNVTVPRSFRTAIKNYLQEREADQDRFESIVMHARADLLTLYCSLRIKPGAFAQRVLFDDDPPEDSRLYSLKMLSWTHDPEEQASLILENRIPYRAAVGAITFMSPPVLIALIAVMSPQEVLNNLASIRNRGVLSNEDLRVLVECKLEEAKTDKRVSALKTRKAIEASGVDGTIQKLVTAVGDARLKSMGRIKRSTALFVDKSASMEEAIEVGKQIAAIIAPVCENGLHVYAFDAIAYRIEARGQELSHWEEAFAQIKPAGSTSCGAPLERMLKENKIAEQIIIVTDQEENAQPFLKTTLKHYGQKHNMIPDVVIVNVGAFSNFLQESLREVPVRVDTFTFDGDYYSLPSIIPLLAEGTRTDLLEAILEYPLPSRRSGTTHG